MSNVTPLDSPFLDTYNPKDCCKFEAYEDVPDLVFNIKQELSNENVLQVMESDNDKEFLINEAMIKNEARQESIEDSDIIKFDGSVIEKYVSIKLEEENKTNVIEKEIEYDTSFIHSEVVIKSEDEQDCMISIFEQKQHEETAKKNNGNKHPQSHQNPPKVMFKCNLCDYQTARKYDLNLHILRHKLRHKNPEEVDMFKCEECSYQTIKKSHLNRHRLQHKITEEIDMLQCNQCTYRTANKSYLKKHLVRHTNLEEVDILKCDQTVGNDYLKASFIENKCPEKVYKFKCDKCDFKTFRKYNLNMHMIRHKNPEDVDMFKCEQCAYRTIKKSYLNKHRLRHKNPKEVYMHQCNLCNYQTIDNSNFRKHVARHKNL